MKKVTKVILLFGLLLPTVWCGANSTILMDGYSHITVKEAHIQGPPKGSTIQATIDGHTLTVVFTENLGSVAIEITTASGVTVEHVWTPTPNGTQTYYNAP